MLAKERLGQLLGMAAKRQWSPLARELCDLVLYWPKDYPDAMYAPVIALTETALREADRETQTLLAGRLASRSDVPLTLMNVLYLAATAPQRREILMRNEIDTTAPAPVMADGASVLAAARNRHSDFTATLSRLSGLPRPTVTAILADASGEPLAVLCRGLGLDRACFSALALLRGPAGMPLTVFDTIPPKAATHLVSDWRRTTTGTLPDKVAAAE